MAFSERPLAVPFTSFTPRCPHPHPRARRSPRRSVLGRAPHCGPYACTSQFIPVGCRTGDSAQSAGDQGSHDTEEGIRWRQTVGAADHCAGVVLVVREDDHCCSELRVQHRLRGSRSPTPSSLRVNVAGDGAAAARGHYHYIAPPSTGTPSTYDARDPVLPPASLHVLRSSPWSPRSQAGVKTPRILIVLDRLMQPENVGGIFRSAMAFGACGMLLRCAPLPQNARASRAARGRLRQWERERSIMVAVGLKRFWGSLFGRVRKQSRQALDNPTSWASAVEFARSRLSRRPLHGLNFAWPSPGCADPLVRKSLRCSMGNVLRMPYAQSERGCWRDDLLKLKRQAPGGSDRLP